MEEEFKWIKPSKTRVKVGIFGKRTLFLNDKTKIVFTYSCGECDYIYELKRKRKIFWKSIAYIRNNTCYDKDLNSVIERLLYKEKEYNQEIEKKRLKKIEESSCYF